MRVGHEVKSLDGLEGRDGPESHLWPEVPSFLPKIVSRGLGQVGQAPFNRKRRRLRSGSDRNVERVQIHVHCYRTHHFSGDVDPPDDACAKDRPRFR